MANYRLTSLKVKGFRGFPEEAGFRDFSFDRPCSLLLGVQGAGKSSTVAAVEWCLFGDEIANKNATGIQERNRWLIKNKKSAETIVELTFTRDGDVLKVYRCDRKRRAKGQPSFYYQQNASSPCEDEARLRVLLGIELPDYMSCVHLHQEVVSALLIEEPRHRKGALDRLMGLDHLRNLLDGIKRAQVAAELSEIDRQFTGIEQYVNATIAVKRRDLNGAVAEAQNHGIEETEQSLEGAKSLCRSTAARIQAFVKDCGLRAPMLPEYQTTENLEPFVAAAKQAVRNLRSEQPDLKRQAEFLSTKSELNQKKANYRSLTNPQVSLNKLKEEHGPRAVVQARLDKIGSELLPEARNRLNSINERAGVIREALKLIDPSKEKIPDGCPVCEQSIDAGHVRQHLEQWQEEMKGTLGPIQSELERLEAEQRTLNEAIQEFNRLEREIKQKETPVSEAREAIAIALNRDIGEGEDPLPLIDERIRAIDDDLEGIRQAVEQSNNRLNTMEDDLDNVRRISAVLELRKGMDTLAKIKETTEYVSLAAAREAAHAFGDKAQVIQEAVQAVLEMLARVKIDSTKEAISQTYRKLVQRRDYPDIEIDPEKYEVMAVGTGEPEVALRILNKGDVNCAALSIFLALAGSSELANNIGFIILDDPSQCLDPPHKERLADVISDLLKDKQIIVATSETDFAKQLQRKAKNKKVYTFQEWTEDQGPQVK